MLNLSCTEKKQHSILFNERLGHVMYSHFLSIIMANVSFFFLVIINSSMRQRFHLLQEYRYKFNIWILQKYPRNMEFDSFLRMEMHSWIGEYLYWNVPFQRLKNKHTCLDFFGVCRLLFSSVKEAYKYLEQNRVHQQPKSFDFVWQYWTNI